MAAHSGLRLAGGAPSRLEVVAAAIVYVLVVHWTYIVVIAPTWSYAGLVYQPAADGSLIAALVAAALPAAALPRRTTRLSSVTLSVLYIVPYVPASLVPHYVLGDGWDLIPLNASLLIAFTIGLLAPRAPVPRIDWPRLAPHAFRWLMVALGVVVALILVTTFGLGDLPGFSQIYDTRADYKDRAADAGRLVGYVVGAAGSALFPFAVVLGVYGRRWFMILLGCAGVLLVYSITAYRSALFAVPLAVGIYLLITYVRPRFVTMALLLFAGAVIVAAMVELVTGNGFLTAMVVRRTLSVPGQLTAYYFDFFSGHAPYRLGHSILGWVVDAPYDVVPPRLISMEYFGNPDANANANLWADGIANFGLVGVIGVSVLLAGLLWLADVASSRTELSLSAPVFVVAAFSLTNSAFLTSLLSHGVIAALILIMVMPRAVPPGAAASAHPSPLRRIGGHSISE